MPYKDKKIQNEYIRSHSKQVCLRIGRSTDPELVEWVEKQDNPSAAVKAVLREYLENSKRGE